MKLSKNEKIILLMIRIQILTTSIVTPILLINNNENNNILNEYKNETQNKNELNLKKVIKLFESKSFSERIIALPCDTRNKIIVNHQEKIISKLKQIIDIFDLKEIKIKISMDQNKNISTNKQKIIIEFSKEETNILMKIYELTIILKKDY